MRSGGEGEAKGALGKQRQMQRREKDEDEEAYRAREKGWQAHKGSSITDEEGKVTGD